MVSRAVLPDFETLSDYDFAPPLQLPQPSRLSRNTNQLEFLRRSVLKSIWKQKYARYFKSSKNSENIEAEHMDLRIIKRRLNTNYYWSAAEAIEDFNSMFADCYAYHSHRSKIVKMAKVLQKKFRKAMQAMPENEVKIDSQPRSRANKWHLLNEMKQKMPEDLKACVEMLQGFFSKECSAYAWPFYRPIDPDLLDLVDYRDIIKEPMDLGTVKSKFQNMCYKNASQFGADIRLILSNCYKYHENTPDHDIIAMAKKLENRFETQYALIPKELNDDSKFNNANGDEHDIVMSVVDDNEGGDRAEEGDVNDEEDKVSTEEGKEKIVEESEEDYANEDHDIDGIIDEEQPKDNTMVVPVK